MSSPPRKIPEELLNGFTLGGRIPIKDFFINKKQERSIKTFTREQVNKAIKLAKNKKGRNYPDTDKWLYEALDKYPVKNKDVVVFGSCWPFYEGICIYYGVKSVTTLELNKRISEDERIRTFTLDEYDNWCLETEESCLFDVAISISTFEHTGLQRYGSEDKLDPFGDIKSMYRCYSMLRENGILFLAVPTGKDCLFYNAHRMYGTLRYQILIDSNYWEVLDKYGWDNDKFIHNEDDYHYQPLFVLQRK